MAPRQGACPGAIPGNRTNLLTPSASLRNRVSKTQFAWGSTKAACQFSRGRGRQAMHLPCKQADVGALPTDSTILRSEPTSSWVRVKDALHSLLAKEGAHRSGSELWMAGQFSLRETRPMHREKPHKLLQVGVTPTPATNFREVIRLPDCKSGVVNEAGSDKLERYQRFPPFRTRSSISRAPRCLREG
jgi:hypothetical protein